MAVLVVGPSPLTPFGCGRLTRSVVEAIRGLTDRVLVFCSYGQGDGQDVLHGDGSVLARIPEIKRVLSEQKFSHVLLIGSLNDLGVMCVNGLGREDLPAISIAYAYTETTYPDPQYCDILNFFDYTVCTSHALARTLYELARTARPLTRHGQIGLSGMRVIRPVADSAFYPIELDSRGPRPEETRAALFPQIEQDAFLILTSGRPTTARGIPELFGIVARLREYRKVCLYCHWPKTKLDVEALADGAGLAADEVLFGYGAFSGQRLDDQQLNLVYNCADLYITTAVADPWPFGLMEAQAAGCPTAAPDDFVWQELGPTHALPLGVFTYCPWNSSEFCNTVDVRASVLLLGEARTEKPVTRPAPADWVGAWRSLLLNEPAALRVS